jgi:DNA-binding protein Fis
MKKTSISEALDFILDSFFVVHENVCEIVDLYETVMLEAEKTLIRKTMLYTRNNKTKAAKILGLSRNTLNFKLKKMGYYGE